jgi:hypothetical protein
MFRRLREELADLAWLFRTLILLATAGAIYRELRLPREQRTWHGQLLGFVPYDFRLPTPQRIRDAYFNTKSDVVFSAQPIGVGWAINVPAVLKRLGVLSSPTPRRRSAKGSTE